ncbi:cell wall protein [Streptomyces mordarskii]|uniref:Cell wall protein n=2 Tax=Streptomyces TaxID=1883 RepID=A0ABN1DXL4_9ACTN
MQYDAPPCQLPHSRTGDSSPKSTPQDDTQCPPATTPMALVHGAAQELEHTTSRRTGPRRWLRAVTWLIAAGHHPKANATTQRVAELLAADMDYDSGHVLYRLEQRAAHISRATIARHVGYLRELGALVWVEHGSRTNRRRLMGLTGYAATATVYAATIPPCFDHAMGHRIVGTGYEARIVVDHRDQSNPVDNSPVDSPSPEGRETPSLTMVKEVGQVQVVGGVTTTEQARLPKITTRRSKTTILGRRVTAAAANRARHLARWLRPLINWTQTASHDQLSWALLDPCLDGWDDQQILGWLSGMTRRSHDGHTWRPDRPHRVIARQLRHEHHGQQIDGGALQPMTPAQWETYHRHQQASATRPGPDSAQDMQAIRTDDERRAARMDARQDFSMVADHIDDYGLDDAIDLYGVYLATRADQLMHSGHYRMGGIHAA